MQYIRSLYLTNRLFILLLSAAILLVAGYFWYPLFVAGKLLVLVVVSILLLEIFILFGRTKGIKAGRLVPERFSNGDENGVNIHVKSYYPFPVQVEIIDEIPFQFQKRDFSITTRLQPVERKCLTYNLRPVERGEYFFGRLLVYVSTTLFLVRRRYSFDEKCMVQVYPSFITMRKYELLAISNRLTEEGIKKVRKKGQKHEFDQIREYVKGDDYRTINWKATARKANLMVNQYQDEKSQQVYSLIDMGRSMKMPFEGLTLLDYSINASLIISKIAMLRYDKAGLFTFSERVHAIQPASRESGQINRMLEILYNQQTGFPESNFEMLYVTVKRKINQRSLLILYTNFESLVTAREHLPFLKKLAKDHLLLTVIFENSEIDQLLDKNPSTTEEIYIKTIAEKFVFDKKIIVKEFGRFGIPALLTRPRDLNINLINKYLEFKSLGLI